MVVLGKTWLSGQVSPIRLPASFLTQSTQAEGRSNGGGASPSSGGSEPADSSVSDPRSEALRGRGGHVPVWGEILSESSAQRRVRLPQACGCPSTAPALPRPWVKHTFRKKFLLHT